MKYSTRLLNDAKKKYSPSSRVCDAFVALPRHDFLTTFSVDHEHWLHPNEETLPLIYSDSTLLLYKKDGFYSTISQPSFVLRMLDLLDLGPEMKVFELGAGSGWNAALAGYLVGKEGKVLSYEIIPEMAEQSQKHLAKFDLPQVHVIQGDAFQEIWDLEDFDRGIFTAGAWDLPGILFDVLKVGGKLLFVLKTSFGDLLLAMKKEQDHFYVFDKIYCKFVTVTGTTMDIYQNDLSVLYHAQGEIRIYPQGTLGLGNNIVAGRDMIFQLSLP